jgi:hypothetical protein
MEKGTKNIIERNTEDGAFKLGQALLELDARIKTVYSVIDEIKEVLQGQAAWSNKTDKRLDRIDPQIILPGDDEFNQTIKGL